MALLLGIARFVVLAPWQRVGDQRGCVGWTFEASVLARWKANIVSIPEIPLCVDVFDGGGLVIFMRQHVCWLTMGGLCEDPSLQKAVCSAASTFVFYSSSVQLPQMMSRCNCDVFIHANGTAPWTAVSAGGLAYAFLLRHSWPREDDPPMFSWGWPLVECLIKFGTNICVNWWSFSMLRL